MKNKIMGLLSALFAFNFAVAAPAVANEQRNDIKNHKGHNIQRIEHKREQVKNVIHRGGHQNINHHLNNSNYKKPHHNNNQQHAKLKTKHKPVVSFIEINTSYIPLLSIIVSKNNIIKRQNHSVQHHKNRHKQQKINQHKRKQDAHYGSVNYLAFDLRR
ncbi:hypothetical protein MT390_03465 [Vibrio sp. 2-Bac 85]